MKHIISTENAPAPVGPYSQAVKSGALVFVSGQIPIDPANGTLVSGTIRDQAIQVLENLKNVLEAAGCTLDDVIKTTVYIADMNHFPELNEIYAEYFGEENAPARSTVQVAALPKSAMVEIDAVAAG
jgi:2-iminobutanoate/2-iminopropanoate deaminase